jgi:hypothetical protein
MLQASGPYPYLAQCPIPWCRKLSSTYIAVPGVIVVALGVPLFASSAAIKLRQNLVFLPE